ncbi:MAG TPA: 2-dehydro-3-deoxygalactonokinase [Burkholderiaceae bacterium]|nr:2-dehydro-3-deoxygalactonokinase [Burkholderiaceae bacterium]
MSSSGPHLVGIDWGTTNRRGYAVDAAGRCLREHADDQGMLASAGRFDEALHDLLAALEADAPEVPVIMSGMVGARQGWREARYLDVSVPLTAISDHLTAVDSTSTPARRCAIVPGYRFDGAAGAVDVLRGEETQLLGAVLLGRPSGWFVLPGTHSKWVLLHEGRIIRFATYLSGELFALLTSHGTLAPLMQAPVDTPRAFAHGLELAGDSALSNALFGCRARVVAGEMPASDARAFLSGLLIGAEWHDMRRRAGDEAPRSVTLIGSAELEDRHAAAGRLLGIAVERLDPRDAYLAALAALADLAPRRN